MVDMMEWNSPCFSHRTPRSINCDVSSTESISSDDSGMEDMDICSNGDTTIHYAAKAAMTVMKKQP